METDVIERRVNRILHLLERVEEIPEELDKIHQKLYDGFLTSKDFLKLANQRASLLVELHNKKKELRMNYRILPEK